MLPYLGSVQWYRKWLHVYREHTSPDLLPEVTLSSIRSCYIRGTRGEQPLTVPIAGGRKKLGRTPYSSLKLSEHDDWRHKHWQAITSAYGALPYFPYFKDEFATVFLSVQIDKLSSLNYELHRAILHCSSLQILADWIKLHPECQTVKRRQCSVPDNISILELLFRYGPEMIFYL